MLKITLLSVFISVGFQTTFAADIPFSKATYQERRARVARMAGDSILILQGTDTSRRSSDIDHPFRQNSSFYYLTGLEEPGTTLVLLSEAGSAPRFILFFNERSTVARVVSGDGLTFQGAKEIYGADEAYPQADFQAKIQSLMEGKKKVFYHLNDGLASDRTQSVATRKFARSVLNALASEQAKARASGDNSSIELRSPYQIIDEMRLIKSPEEISLLQKAIDVTELGFRAAWNQMKTGTFEYQVASLIRSAFSWAGSDREAFPGIIAFGQSAVALHYVPGNRAAQKNELALLDLGAEYGYYSADVTRTHPIGGKFSAEQRQIYEIVLETQRRGINGVAPGVSMAYLQKQAVDFMRKPLFDLGLVKDMSQDWQVRIWFAHGMSHWLGMDTHDCGSYNLPDGSARALKANMVLTVEPGLYISRTKLDQLPDLIKLYRGVATAQEMADFISFVKPAVERFHGIGVRIEDDILVTPTGHFNMSEKIPREISEMETL